MNLCTLKAWDNIKDSVSIFSNELQRFFSCRFVVMESDILSVFAFWHKLCYTKAAFLKLIK